MIRAVSTLTCRIRRIAVTRSRGSSNQPLGSLTIPLFLSWTILSPLRKVEFTY